MTKFDPKSEAEFAIPKENYPSDYGKEFVCPKDGVVWSRIAKVEGLPNICPVCSNDKVLEHKK